MQLAAATILIAESSYLGRWGKAMRFGLPIACVLTFCIVCIGNSDAIIPLGYLLAEFLRDESIPLAVRLLLLVPFAGTVGPSLIKRSLVRSILTSVGVVALFLLWLFVIFAFVVYPMPDNQIPNSVPAITSIPFVLLTSLTLALSVRKIFRKDPQ
jgi:hypothetical protein